MTANLPRKDRLYRHLKNVFSPQFLEVTNESHHHASHSGSPKTGESHYKVCIQAAFFKGLSLKDIHRHINDAVAEEFKTGLHALSIKVIRSEPSHPKEPSSC